MLDINFIRNNPDVVRKAMADKGHEADLDRLLQLDEERRRLIFESEQLRSLRRKNSERIAELKRQKKDASDLVAQTREVGDKVKEYESQLDEIEPKIHELMLLIPNIPAPDVPVGPDASANEVVREWGKPAEFDFEPKPHWDLGTALDILDLKRGSKICGPAFPLFKGDGARMERALFNFMLDLHTSEHGYKEVFPPFLANRASMLSTAQLPKLEDDMYRTLRDDFFLIPTAEVPVTNIHRGEILSHEELPIYYTAYTPCFRREAGAYGKETRGLLRVHQFDKVELVKFVKPETSYDELESLVKNAEEVLQRLGLHYRVSKLSTGDMSFAAAKCYDLEVWSPGVKKWLEVSSCSNFVDFQARRGDIRFRDEDGKVKFVHTLNGSGVALARTILAIMENFQRGDGTIAVPEVLRPYMGKDIIGE